MRLRALAALPLLVVPLSLCSPKPDPPRPPLMCNIWVFQPGPRDHPMSGIWQPWTYEGYTITEWWAGCHDRFVPFKWDPFHWGQVLPNGLNVYKISISPGPGALTWIVAGQVPPAPPWPDFRNWLEWNEAQFRPW